MIDFYHSVHFYNDLSSTHSANSLELLSQNILSLKLEEKGKLSVVVKQVPYYRQIPVLDIFAYLMWTGDSKLILISYFPRCLELCINSRTFWYEIICQEDFRVNWKNFRHMRMQ